MKKWLSSLLVICLLMSSLAFAVSGEKITSIQFTYSDMTKQVGSEFQMSYVVTPQQAANGGIVWVSSDPATVKVNQKGYVTCLKAGLATIKAISKGSVASAACVIEVVKDASSATDTPIAAVKKNVPVQAIAINQTLMQLPVGNSRYLIATFTPRYASNRSVKWYVTDERVASIDSNGLLVAKQVGETTVVAESNNGKTFQCKVYVVPITKTNSVDLNSVVLPFNDVYGVPELDSIRYVYKKELMNGVSADQFSPYGGVSRAMMATILYRIQGEPGGVKHKRFQDVAWEMWYASPVFWIDKVGIMKGVSKNSFAPDGALTREQLATILFRFADFKGLKPKGPGYLYDLSDRDQVSNWATEAVQWAYDNYILKVDRGLIYPQATASRADVARAIHVFFSLLE